MLSAARAPGALDVHPSPSGGRAFTRYAWFVLAFLLGVVLFGAWVRVTGSGAGCGSHWPTCHGDVIPRSPSAKTLIEFTHRATSGLLGILVLALAAAAFVVHAGRKRVLAAALVTLVFTVIEAAIGAGIVLKELVENDASVARALVITIHLASTFTLTGATALTAFWSTRQSPLSFAAAPRRKWAFVVATACIVLVSMTGAVTALGDTIFPVSPTEATGLLARLRSDLDPASHFLVRLRIVHPILAVAVSAGLLAFPAYLSQNVSVTERKLLDATRVLVLSQVALGVGNIALGAPGWLQLVHLLFAQGVWLTLLLAFAASLETEPASLPS